MLFERHNIISDLNVNELLNIDNSTVPINGVQEPLINSCFINDNLLFVNLYHRMTFTNWHFLYLIDEAKILGKAYSNVLP